MGNSAKKLETRKTFSFGGLGDSYIVYLKLKNALKLNENLFVDHVFIESNETVPKLIKQVYPSFLIENERMSLESCCVENYEQKYRAGESGPWDDRIPLNTSVDGTYLFPARDGGLGYDVLIPRVSQPRGLFTIQVSAGANNTRNWKFDPRVLVNLLRRKGYKVFLVGTDPKFEDKTDRDNFVNQINLVTTLGLIYNSQVHIGLSGFLTYWSLNHCVPNIHFEESPEHNKHYIHPSWEQFRYGIKFGALSEIIEGLRYYGVEI